MYVADFPTEFIGSETKVYIFAVHKKIRIKPLKLINNFLSAKHKCPDHGINVVSFIGWQKCLIVSCKQL